MLYPKPCYNEPCYKEVEVYVASGTQAHHSLFKMSRMLIGELIVYQWSGVRHPSIRLSTFSNIFSKTACPIKAKFLCGASLGRRTKVCSHHLGHMTKMAATPIYGKNPSKIFFSRTGRPIFTKLGTPQPLYNTSV